MTTENFLPYGKQIIDDYDISAVTNALKGDLITRGTHVQEFEEKVASYCGAEYAVAFNSGTSALHAAYFAGDLQPCDRVLTSPNTFFGTVAYPVEKGIKPIFIDIDRSSGNIDLELLGCNLYHSSTRAKTFVVPVHFAGIPVDMPRLQSMIGDEKTVVIEDAAHAIGSSYETGEKVGSCAYSDMTIFSFHPVKTITTGEGGMVTTNYRHLYDRLKLYRDNGVVRDPAQIEKNGPWYYEVREATGNYHMTEIQAALGVSQLGKLTQFATKRRTLVSHYREELNSHGAIKLFHPEHDEHTCYHLMVAQIDFEKLGLDRAKVMVALKEEGIGSQVHYIPLYKHPIFKHGEMGIESYFPNTEAYYAQAISLPLFPTMKKGDVKQVCKVLNKVLKVKK